MGIRKLDEKAVKLQPLVESWLSDEFPDTAAVDVAWEPWPGLRCSEEHLSKIVVFVCYGLQGQYNLFDARPCNQKGDGFKPFRPGQVDDSWARFTFKRW